MTDLARRLGDYIATYDWDHWLTLTPRSPDCRPSRLERCFECRFIRKMEQAAQHRVSWVNAIEVGPGGVFHIHALLAGTAHLSPAYIGDKWELGRADVERYDSTRGAAWYLSKTYGKEEHWERFNLSRYMPPRSADRRAA
jgi:hypothetical protein